MGIKKTKLILRPGRHGTAGFFPGETVNGAVVLEIDGSKPHKLRAVMVKVRGKAVTDWTTGSDDDKESHSETQRLLCLDVPLMTVKDSRPIMLPPGQHKLPLTFTLPSQLAHSQQHLYGHVSYECKVRAISHSFWSFNGRVRAKFQVLPHRDLSRELQLARPLTVKRQARPAPSSRDPGQFQLHLSRQGFVAGEVIDVWLDGPDKAFEVLAGADDDVQLQTRVEFLANSSTEEATRAPAAVWPGRSSAAWRHLQLIVPQGQVSMDSSSGCNIISVTHYVKVWDVHLPITLGTVPLPPS